MMTEKDKVPTRTEISEILRRWDKQIINSFPENFSKRDCYGFEVNREAVCRYLNMIHDHSIEVIRETIVWAPGKKVGEIGVAYGQNLLPLFKDFGFKITGYDLQENIGCYCNALELQEVVVEGFDMHSEALFAPKEQLDFLIFSEVLEHLFVDVVTVVDRLTTFVRPGGRILLTTPNFYRYGNLQRMFRGQNLCERHPLKERIHDGAVIDGRTHPREYTLFEVAQAFGESGKWNLLKCWTALNHAGIGKISSLMKRAILKAVFQFPMKNSIFVVAERKNNYFGAK